MDYRSCRVCGTPCPAVDAYCSERCWREENDDPEDYERDE